MKKRNRMVKLRSKSGKRVGDLPPTLEVKVIQHDSIAGYYAEIPFMQGKPWRFFDPADWEEVK